MFKLAQKPLTPRELIAESFRLWKVSLKPMLPMCFGLILLTSLPVFFIPELNTFYTREILGELYEQMGLTLLFIVLAQWSFAVVYHRLYTLTLKRTDTIINSLIFGLKRLPALLVATLLLSLTVMAGSILAIVPGFIFAFYLAMYYPIVIQDNENPIEAYKHSWRLVRGHWFHTAGTMCIILVIGIVAGIVIGETLAGVLVIQHRDGGEIWMAHNVARVLVNTLYYPLLCSVINYTLQATRQ